MKYLIRVLMIFCLIGLSSCETPAANEKNSETSTKNTSYSLTSQTFTKKTDDEDEYVIDYPLLKGEGTEKSNQLIRTYLQDLYIMNDNDDNLTLKMNYHVSLQTASVISIVFEGEARVDDMHEDLLLTLNIDVKKGQIIRLSDLYTINKGFKKVYFQETKKQVPTAFHKKKKEWERTVNTFQQQEKEFVNNEFKTSDYSFGGVQSFLTKNGVGISMVFINEKNSDEAHYETILPYSKIKSYLKRNKPIDIPPSE